MRHETILKNALLSDSPFLVDPLCPSPEVHNVIYSSFFSLPARPDPEPEPEPVASDQIHDLRIVFVLVSTEPAFRSCSVINIDIMRICGLVSYFFIVQIGLYLKDRLITGLITRLRSEPLKRTVVLGKSSRKAIRLSRQPTDTTAASPCYPHPRYTPFNSGLAVSLVFCLSLSI